MKKIALISSFILLGISPMVSQNVNIPDANFLAALIALGVDTNADGLISKAEAEAVTWLNVSNKSISDLTGIESFVNLIQLACSNNQLTSLDFFTNTTLTNLFCSSNQLISLDVSFNAALTILHCYSNPLTSLDVSNNAALTLLWCSGNQLTSLDISNNTALDYLYCSDNQLTSLDVSNNAALNLLYCYNNQLTSLDVSINTALAYLWCSGNQLTSLDFSNNIALDYLNCSDNQLTSLDVSNNAALTSLACSNNQLTSLDVSNNAALTLLGCPINQLTSLDISNNTALTNLTCSSNQLTSLDISNNTALTSLYLSDMPTLSRVCVWEMPFPPVTLNLDITGSPNIYFTTECTVDISSLKVENGIIIYPNPAKEYLTIDLSEYSSTEDYSLKIINMIGTTVFETRISKSKYEINTSNWSGKGVYVLQVFDSNKIIKASKKIILQ